MERVDFTICQSCAAYPGHPDFLYRSTSHFTMCADCRTYNPSGACVTREYPVEFVSSEDCDCEAKHGSIQHRDGGNYHLTKFRVEHQFIDNMTDAEYDEALAEEFARVKSKEEIPFKEWKAKNQK